MKLALGTMILVLFSIHTQAEETKLCVATKNNQIGYASAMNYQVGCLNSVIETESIVTSFLFPLPYNWGKKARKILDQQMDVFGRERVGFMDAGLEDDILIYDEKGTAEKVENFCTANKFNYKKIGINQDQIVFDIALNCGDQSVINEHIQGISDEELKTYMKDIGYEFAVEAKISNRGVFGTGLNKSYYSFSSLSLFKK